MVLKLNLIHRFMVCADSNLLGENKYYEEKKGDVLVVSKNVCLQVSGVKVSVYVTLSECRTVSHYEDS